MSDLEYIKNLVTGEEMRDLEFIKNLVDKARTAQEQVSDYTQEQIDEVCLAVAWQVYKDDNIAKCARVAVDETGMGVYEDKIKKHKVKVGGVIRDVMHAKSVGVIERNTETGITKYAKPVGVVGALTPVTNPTATPASNGVGILKGRNAVIFAPHPRAKQACKVACEFMRDGLRQVGAPVDLIQYIEKPGISISKELMRQVDLVLATGGSAMVQSAYSSGTPAYGVGVGNPVIIIAEDADMADAAEKISISKTFDNATSCSSENSLVIQESVFDRAVEELQNRGAYLCTADEKKKLENLMWSRNEISGSMVQNASVIAQSAQKIALDAGIEVPDSTRFLMVLGEEPGVDQFSGEKISPVIALWKYGTFDEALKMVRRMHLFAGKGHSAGLYTYNQAYIEEAAASLDVSRMLVRQAHAPSAGGNLWNRLPSTVTMGCGTWGGNITTENIHWRHFINVTWLAEPVAPREVHDEDLFGPLWSKYGK